MPKETNAIRFICQECGTRMMVSHVQLDKCELILVAVCKDCTTEWHYGEQKLTLDLLGANAVKGPKLAQ